MMSATTTIDRVDQPTTEIRLISLWQPWASLIALGLKRYETRSWSTHYKGKIAIHAAKRPFIKSKDGIDIKIVDRLACTVWTDALALGYESGLLTDESKLPFAWNLPLGAIVAVADLTDCLEMIEDLSKPPSLAANIHLQTKLESAVGDWQPDRYAWKVENVCPIAHPIPFKGFQGMRRITDPMVLEAIDQQIEATPAVEL